MTDSPQDAEPESSRRRLHDNLLGGAPSPHETNYNLIATAIATAAATMLTLLTTLGTTSQVMGNMMLKGLLEAELLVIELALILSIVSLLRHGEATKKLLVHMSSALVVVGTLLLWFSATTIMFFT